MAINRVEHGALVHSVLDLLAAEKKTEKPVLEAYPDSLRYRMVQGMAQFPRLFQGISLLSQ